MKSHEEQRGILFFLAGFFIGVIYIYFMGASGATEEDFLSVQNLMQVTYMDVVYEEYFWFLVKKRIGILLVLVAASFALPGKYLLLGFLMVFGCSMGSMLSVLIVRYGLKGILLFLGLVFPQDLIYIPVVLRWEHVLERWNEGIFWRRNAMRQRRSGRWYGGGRVVVLLMVTIIGILLECYVNPLVVNWCLKFF